MRFRCAAEYGVRAHSPEASAVAGPGVVRVAPSLVISLDEILEGLAGLEQALGRALT
jgi:acetylornithine/succinyldiaminopimelate/putrescine aminotransferase